jgi:putative membrane protein
MSATASAAVIAFLHHVLAFGLVSALAAQAVLLRGELTLEKAQALRSADKALGISAALLLIVGLARVLYFEKGAAYYFHSATFLAKLSLFALLALVSVIPTLEFLGWRGKLREGLVPQPPRGKLRIIRALVHAELAGIVLILLFAALMARGIGLP